jgi:hypothetical protein
MIEKLLLDHDTEEQLIALTEKLNEVIEVVNDRASFEEKVFGHPEVAKAARKAATTGNRADLHEYLRLRKKFL